MQREPTGGFLAEEVTCHAFRYKRSLRLRGGEWILGHTSMKAVLEVRATVAASKAVAGEMLRSGLIQNVFSQ